MIQNSSIILSPTPHPQNQKKLFILSPCRHILPISGPCHSLICFHYHSFAFFKCFVIHYGTVTGLLLSFNIMSLRCLQVVADLFLYMVSSSPLFDHSPTERHLGCCQFLANINKNTIPINVRGLPWTRIFIFQELILRSEMSGRYVSLCLRL